MGKREGGRFALRDEGERRFKGSRIKIKGMQGEIKKKMDRRKRRYTLREERIGKEREI